MASIRQQAGVLSSPVYLPSCPGPQPISFGMRGTAPPGTSCGTSRGLPAAGERPRGGRIMRNLLALLAAVVLVVAGLGWYLGWFHVRATPTGDRRRRQEGRRARHAPGRNLPEEGGRRHDARRDARPGAAARSGWWDHEQLPLQDGRDAGVHRRGVGAGAAQALTRSSRLRVSGWHRAAANPQAERSLPHRAVLVRPFAHHFRTQQQIPRDRPA